MAKKKKRNRKKRKATKSVPAMVITKGRRKHIVRLGEILSVIAPATARGKTSFCLENIALEKGHKKLWKNKSNKAKSFAAYFEQLFRKFPRLPKKVTIELVEGGVTWCAKRGNVVTEDQIQEIVATLAELGVSAKKELLAIERPDKSQVVKPTLDLQSKIGQLDLHPALQDDVIQMFKDGHLNDAVRKALERFEKLVQDQLGEHEIGKTLMAKAFNIGSGVIRINDGTNGNDQSEQEGFMHLTMGAMAGMRNLYSHGDLDTMAPMDAFERLCFVSLLFKRFDAAILDAAENSQTP